MADKEVKKTPAKKKVVIAKKAVVEKKVAAPKKAIEKLPAKKVLVKKVAMPGQVTRIYEDLDFLKPASSMQRDLIKILARNPLEAYVFWKIHSDHFERVREEFTANHPSDIQLKLKIEFINFSGKPDQAWYDLAPMTTSYYCKFTSPVKQIRAYIYANYFGKLKLFLETGDGDLPPGIESYKLHKDWIHPRWIELGWVKQDKNKEWSFTEAFDPKMATKEGWSFGFDGSSGGGSQSFVKEKK